jgi:hypothetical protein
LLVQRGELQGGHFIGRQAAAALHAAGLRTAAE